MDPRPIEKTHGADLIHENATKSCCHSEANGVENVGFEAVAPEAHHSHHHKEEIGLQGMNYKPLCSCDEGGTPCKCGNNKIVYMNRTEIRTQPWGKWKCIALSFILLLTTIWVVVFVSLLVTGVI